MFDLIQPDWPAPANVHGFTTTRKGGISRAQWSSLNLGGNCGDDPKNVQKNRILLRSLLPSKPHWLKQVHGAGVVSLDEIHDAEQQADASVCGTLNRVCTVLTADCLPVLFCNKAGTRVAAAHAGWRGLADGVLRATVAAMDCKPADVLAWFGPAIGPNAFEVGQDVRTTYLNIDEANAVAFKPHKGRWLADLYGLAGLALARVGVNNVSGGQYCTHTDQQKFFSYRRDGETGRMATLIWLSS